MSLQMWLPLNGDLHNQGLSNFNIVTNNVTFVNTGKIGQCASFNGSNSYIYINNINLGNNWSYGCWINTPASDSRGWEIVIILNNTGSDADSQLAFWVHQKENRFETLANTQYNSTISYAAYYGTWHHFFATFNGNVLTTYIDGIIVNTKTITAAQYTGTNLTIGARCTGANGSSFGNYFQGQLNDVRIYDHCLSNKEVEEIAKGLVLHYKLDGASCPNQNLLKLIPRDYSPTSYNSYKLTLQENLEANQTYTMQLWDVNVSHTGKTENNLGLSVYWGGGNLKLKDLNGTSYFTDGYANHLIFTFTPTTAQAEHANAANLWLNIYNSVPSADGTKNMHIGAWKLEKGNIATPWSNDENIVYDSSGYENNGTIIGGSISSDTIRHSTSTNFTNSQYIYVNKHCAEFLPKDAITVNLWQNSTSWANPISCTEGGGFNFENASAIRFQVYMSGVGYKQTNSNVTAASLNGSWHMLTGTVDSENIKLYIDGELKTTTPMTTTAGIGYANNYLFIAAEASGDTTTPTNSNYVGNISDVRIYATALSPEQILELYHTSATIDNMGNVYARELVEK